MRRLIRAEIHQLIVRYDVLRSTVTFHDATKEGADIDRFRLFLENGEAHEPAGWRGISS